MDATQRGFMRRFRMGDSLRDNPILEAIFDNNVAQFKSLVAADPATITNPMFLYYVIKLKRLEMFDYVLNFDTFDPDCPDNVGRNVLMGLASVPENDHFALALIEKGANVRWRDGSGFTFLHMAARAVGVDNAAAGRAAIERGADVNAATDRGETPLFVACEEGNYPFCCLLLFYGADATLTNDKGVLPVAATSRWVPPELQPELQELLFDYTFDDDKQVVSLSTLVEAMISHTPLFANIVENSAEVTCSNEDLEHFCGSLKYLRPQHLRLFIARFGNIISELITDHSFLITIVKLGWICDNLGFKELLDVFIESEYFPEMVKASDPSYATVACLVEVFNQRHLLLDREEVTKMACMMLSYGLGVTSRDLDVVYECYGYCELFRILLHMDILMVDKKQEYATVASLYYNPNASVEDVVGHPLSYTLLDFYNHPKLKEAWLKSDNEEVVAKAKSLPHVPYLVELARNAGRKYIIDRYKTVNSRQFHTVLKWLPIGDINKKIIALERKLYCWM